MSWVDRNLQTVLTVLATPAAVALLHYLAKGFPVVWGALRRTEEVAQLRTERDQYRDMWALSVKKSSDDAEKFLKALAKLRGESSSPPST